MTKPSLAVETFSLNENNTDLLLLGIDGIEKANIDFSEAVYYKHITSDNSIKNVIGVGPENKFLYKIASYKDNAVVACEYGIGYAYEMDERTYFKRDRPLIQGKNEIQKQVIYNNGLRFYSPPNSTNVITSEIPTNITGLYFEKNMILVSRDAFVPHPMKILDNSFLARIGDSDLYSVKFDSKEFSDLVASAINNYSKQLAMKSSKLSVNKASIKHLQLEPSSKTNAKKGTFIYDEDNDVVKFYNGKIWRTLQWAEEENPE